MIYKLYSFVDIESYYVLAAFPDSKGWEEVWEADTFSHFMVLGQYLVDLLILLLLLFYSLSLFVIFSCSFHFAIHVTHCDDSSSSIVFAYVLPDTLESAVQHK